VNANFLSILVLTRWWNRFRSRCFNH